MNRDFSQINNSLTEQLFQQARLQFQRGRENIFLEPLALQLLPTLLQNLKISIPEPMMKDYVKCLDESHEPQMSFKQFTHYIARASLQTQIQQELKNLFFLIDREESGTINARDLWLFIKELDGSDTLNQRDIDGLMKELDQKEMGFLTYQDFIYGLIPK